MQIEYRPATDDDLELIMAWRSHPQLYQKLYIQEGPLEWGEHVDWWDSREDRRDWIITINTDGHWRDIGGVNVSELDSHIPEIGVFIGEITLWGNGIATQAVKFAIEWLQERDYAKAKARILNDNEGSKQVFKKVGFQRVGDAREGESEYHISL